MLLAALREFNDRELTYSVDDEKDMIPTDFIGITDPAKPSKTSVKTKTTK